MNPNPLNRMYSLSSCAFSTLIFVSLSALPFFRCYAQETKLIDKNDASFVSSRLEVYFSLNTDKRGDFFCNMMTKRKKNGKVLQTYSADVILNDLESLAGKGLGLEIDWNFLGELQITNFQNLPKAVKYYNIAVQRKKYQMVCDKSIKEIPARKTDESLYEFESGIMLTYSKYNPACRIEFVKRNITIIPIEILQLMQKDLESVYNNKISKNTNNKNEILKDISNYNRN